MSNIIKQNRIIGIQNYIDISRTLSIQVQMDFIQGKIRQLASQLIKARKYNYSQDSLYNYLENNPATKYQHTLVKNKRGQNLDTMLIKHSYSDTCIVYAHGLGSNKIEVLSLVQCAKNNNYHICAFDFSGSGRSQGQFTTYGVRQQDDINAILTWLDASRLYSKYVLWGRSMGGASIILSQSRNLNKKVQCIVLDSPFSSFEKAAVEIASKFSLLPQIMLNFLIQPIKQRMKKQYKNVNPFDLDICGAASKIQSRIMLIYSKGDTIVNFNHSKEIGRSCKRDAVEIEIQEDHNKPRRKQTYIQALKFITQSIQMFQSRAKRSMSKGRGISVSSKQNRPQNKSMKSRKSISSSITSQKYSENQYKSQNYPSVGSFVSTSSNIKDSLKQAYIKSVVLQKDSYVKQNFRNTIKYTNKYRHCARLL